MIESGDIWMFAFAAAVNGNGSKLQSAATVGQLIIAVGSLLIAGAAFQYSQTRDVAAAERRLTQLESRAEATALLAADTRARQYVNEQRITQVEKDSALAAQALQDYKQQMAVEHATILRAVGGAVSIYNAPQNPRAKR